MKKLLMTGLLSFVLTTVGWSASAKNGPVLPDDGEWHKIYDAEYRLAPNHGQYPRMFMKTHSESEGTYDVSKVEYNCKNEQYNLIFNVVYDKNGKVKSQWNAPYVDWLDVIPDSRSELGLALVCGKAL